LYLTELTAPTNVEVVSRNNTVVAYVIGEDTPAPPTEQFSVLDEGDIFAVPNAVYNVSIENPILEPSKYGMDFWQALNGELVTVRSPVGVARPNQFGDTWIVGTWPTTGRNEHDGLTMTDEGEFSIYRVRAERTARLTTTRRQPRGCPHRRSFGRNP
jgi:hypothetical protein